MAMRKPRPVPPKIRPATERMTQVQLQELAGQAVYEGSPHHKDVPSMGHVPAPRKGAMHLDRAEEQGIDNPDCLICPRKWVGKQDQATDLLRAGISRGQCTEDASLEALPSKVWVRDPDDASIVYEAKRLTFPVNGYKAYPLTSRQARFLPLTIA